MLLNTDMQISSADIRSIKQMFMMVLLQFISYTPIILNLDLSGYNTPCILKVLSSIWQAE